MGPQDSGSGPLAAPAGKKYHKHIASYLSQRGADNRQDGLGHEVTFAGEFHLVSCLAPLLLPPFFLGPWPDRAKFKI